MPESTSVRERPRAAPQRATRSRPNRGRPDRFEPGNARWILSLLVWATLMSSLASLHPLFQGVTWWFVPALVSGLVLTAAAAARAVHWPSALASFAGLVVGYVATMLLVSDGTAVLGVIPTAETIDRIRTLTQQARDVIVGGQAPVEVGEGLLVVLVASVAAAAVLLDVLARVSRMPGLTGIPFALVLAVPALIPDIDPSWGWVVVTVIGYLAILVVSSGRRPSRASLVTGIAAVAVAGIVTAVLPGSLSSPLTGVGSGTGISTGVNPVINLGKDLRRGDPVTVLTYSTTADQGSYLKLVDLVDFSGTRWSPASVRLDSGNSVADLPAAPGISDATTRDRVTTDVSVNLLRSPYLPLPVPATRITGIDDAWKYVDESGVTVRSRSEGSQGLDYTVVSRPVDPTREQIVQSLQEPPADLSAYLDVDGVPGSISGLAKQVTDGAANPFDAAVDLQDYFRNGDFTYSEDTPVRRGYDGSGLDMVETFLQTKSGYCVHFASAMAVMARTLGIPSRIAVGFLPGTENGASDEWTVTSNDLHTWPELYFQGLGWVPFEPTVGQGTTSSYLQQTGAEATPSASATDSATSAPTDAATGSTSTAGPDTSGPTDPAAASSRAASAASSAAPGAPVAIGGVIVLLIVLAMPWWLRTSRRRRRLGQGPPDAGLAAWREVVDTARDLGIPVDPAATPLVVGGSLRSRVGDEGSAALSSLLAATETERFGGIPADEQVHADARTVIQRLRNSATTAARVRAALVPRSLFAEPSPRLAE